MDIKSSEANVSRSKNQKEKKKKRTIPSNVKYVQWAERKEIPEMNRNELEKKKSLAQVSNGTPILRLLRLK